MYLFMELSILSKSFFHRIVTPPSTCRSAITWNLWSYSDWSCLKFYQVYISHHLGFVRKEVVIQQAKENNVVFSLFQYFYNFQEINLSSSKWLNVGVCGTPLYQRILLLVVLWLKCRYGAEGHIIVPVPIGLREMDSQWVYTAEDWIFSS